MKNRKSIHDDDEPRNPGRQHTGPSLQLKNASIP
jgi:hypothetical protein